MLAFTWRVERPAWPVEGPCVLAFWHGEQLPLILLHRRPGIVGVASMSRDGAILAGVLAALGFGVIRGSSSKGAMAVLWACRDAIRRGESPALAVDGPRGPAKRIQPGAEALARANRVPLVFVSARARGLRLSSWDRFLIPWPFAKVQVRYGVWRGEGSLAEAWADIEPEAVQA